LHGDFKEKIKLAENLIIIFDSKDLDQQPETRQYPIVKSR